mgnify:CR=1 FL=1
MHSDRVNTISTAVIAFVTVLGLAIGFYYNLKSINTKELYIWILEILLLTLIALFTKRINEIIKNGY